jgi:hypothetical protein
MFRWLFLNESALAPAEHAAWKISTLRILLVSGFILEAWVALHSSFRAVERGAYEILLTVISLYALKSVAIWGSRKYPRFSAALLLLNIYGIASAISIFTRDPELAKLGYLFVYITPILARIFSQPSCTDSDAAEYNTVRQCHQRVLTFAGGASPDTGC